MARTAMQYLLIASCRRSYLWIRPWKMRVITPSALSSTIAQP